MKLVQVVWALFFLILFSHCFDQSKIKTDKDVLFRICDTISKECGYKNSQGDTTIPIGKYANCFTDTFDNYAIVSSSKYGFVGIDKQERILFTVYAFDNGPDCVVEGLFRIVDNGKIGYVEAKSGKIVIQPEYTCAMPFEQGLAKVAVDCTRKQEGEYHSWLSDHWIYIDKKGQQVNPSK